MLFCIQHSLFASEWWKLRMRGLLGNAFRFYRFYYSVFSVVILLFLLYLQFTIESAVLWKPSGLLRFIAVLTGTAGIIIMLACIRKYFFFVSGVRVFFREKPPVSVLQTQGLNRHMRHPLYFATLVLIWSFFLFFPLWKNLIAGCIISIYTMVGIHIEERKLSIEFGESYKIYARKTPMLIPRFFVRLTKQRHSFPKTV